LKAEYGICLDGQFAGGSRGSVRRRGAADESEWPAMKWLGTVLQPPEPRIDLRFHRQGASALEGLF
jgi:hypothetical protein